MWYRILFLHLMGLIVVISQTACLAQSSKTGTLTQNVESSNQDDIRKLWIERTKGINRKTKNHLRERLDAMLEILARIPDKQVKAEQERIYSSPTGYDTLSEYEQVFLQANVSLLTDKRNDGELIKLLSLKPPRFVATIPLELHLATKHPSKLRVLFSGYEEAKNEDTKKMLISILASIFPDFREKTKSDEDFVNTSKTWYFDNESLQVNPHYSPFSSWPSQRIFFKQE